MDIKICKLLFLTQLFIYVNTISAANIVVERYENWNHPVLKVFKRYSTVLYKVHYSKDGRYPIFCVRLSGDPQIAINDHDLRMLYLDTLKANSDYPFAFIDKRFGTGPGIRVNVKWLTKDVFQSDLDDAHISICDVND